MKIIDLSQPVFDLCPNCPAHPPVRMTIISTHERDDWQMERLDMASHSGSHIDAPRHKLANGATLDEIPLETFQGTAFIADLRPLAPDTPIDSALLQRFLPPQLDDKIVLLCTGWGEKRDETASEEWLHHSPFLSPEGAHWLVERKVRAVGIDHYSIGGSREPQNAQTHEVLLGAGMWVVEELRFSADALSAKQPCQFWCLPLHLRGASGAPCRPIIVVD